jgi:tetratricopeptide (TPR) repeat protein
MERMEWHAGPGEGPHRGRTYFRIAQRLIDELGDEADEHCLTITYHLLRAGRLADGPTVVRFASQAAEIACRHRCYYVAGRYFDAAARAGISDLAPDERAELHRRAGEAFQRLSDRAMSMACFQAAIELYLDSGNQAGLARSLHGALGNRLVFGQWVAKAASPATAHGLAWLLAQLPEPSVELRIRAHDAAAAGFYRLARYQLAEAHAQAALSQARQSCDPRLRAIAVRSQALARRAKRRLAEVRSSAVTAHEAAPHPGER